MIYMISVGADSILQTVSERMDQIYLRRTLTTRHPTGNNAAGTVTDDDE